MEANKLEEVTARGKVQALAYLIKLGN